MSNSIDQLYEVLSRRTPSTQVRYQQCRTPSAAATFHLRFQVQQCRTPSTNCMSSPVSSNSISTRLRWHACQQCRTPSTNCMSSPVSSNSISTCPRWFARLRVNNVELHRQVSSQWCLHSTMSISIGHPR